MFNLAYAERKQLGRILLLMEMDCAPILLVFIL